MQALSITFAHKRLTKHLIRKFCAQTKHQQQQQWTKPQQGHDTGIQVYSCIARGLIPVILPNPKLVTWYTCGPTVYDATHLGHASCYVKLDIIQRILREHFKLHLVTAMNITDIDDKIILRSQERACDWRELARQYEAEFWGELRKLNVLEPNIKIRVTEQIPAIISFIASILEKGYAYVGTDQSVYFNVEKYPAYGKLQRLILEASESETSKILNKAAAPDFALWKSQKHANEPSWPSPWGAGRPGWHIECSALATLIFGENIDFHAGGLDLKFPHHENEEAQSCVYHNSTQWVNYWLHTGHLSIKGQQEKMSKSLKNTISIGEMLKSNTSDDFRMACLLSNYRNPVEYGVELMETSRNTLNKFKTFAADCEAYLSGKKLGTGLVSSEILNNLKNAEDELDACFKQDFDTASSVSVLLGQISNISRCINANAGNDLIASRCLDAVAAVDNFVQKYLRIFGLSFAGQEVAATVSPLDVKELLEDVLEARGVIRERAVSTKNKELFRICDELRYCLRRHGVEIRDHSQGSSWTLSENKKL